MSPKMSSSKRKARLQFKAAIVRRLGKSEASGVRGLICQTKQGRGDVADNRTGIRVIDDVANRHRDTQAVPMTCR